MDIQEILKQLKSINPDGNYARRSRHTILGTAPHARTARGGIMQFFITTIAEGSAIALAGVLLLLVFAGFSTWNFLSPFGTASLDPLSLRAEADAIDIQVKLTNLVYPEVTEQQTSTPAAAPAALTTRDVTSEVQREAKALGINPPAAASTSSAPNPEQPATIDEAIDRLTQ